MAHEWYVKKRYQTDHNERAAELEIEIILEDTSPQVDSADQLPHVIIQIDSVNVVLIEPTTRQEIDAAIRAEGNRDRTND